MLDITTNHHNRFFKYRYEVPESVLKDYSWLNEEDSFDGWICYKGRWSHISDYMYTDRIPGWDGYVNDCMSSGTLIKTSDDMETYKIGYFVSVSA